jgi:hypothetical protein
LRWRDALGFCFDSVAVVTVNAADASCAGVRGDDRGASVAAWQNSGVGDWSHVGWVRGGESGTVYVVVLVQTFRYACYNSMYCSSLFEVLLLLLVFVSVLVMVASVMVVVVETVASGWSEWL